MPRHLHFESREADQAFRPLLDAVSRKSNDGDWNDVLNRVPKRHVHPQRVRILIPAVVVMASALAVIAVTPALGVRSLISSFFDEPAAPTRVIETFGALDSGAPSGFAPGVAAPQARLVHTFPLIEGGSVELWVAPAANAGYCAYAWRYFEGCRQRNDQEVSFGTSVSATGNSTVVGDIPIESGAQRISVVMSNGARLDATTIWVSQPINAGFYFFETPTSASRAGIRPVQVVALDQNNRVISSKTIPPPQLPG